TPRQEARQFLALDREPEPRRGQLDGPRRCEPDEGLPRLIEPTGYVEAGGGPVAGLLGEPDEEVLVSRLSENRTGETSHPGHHSTSASGTISEWPGRCPGRTPPAQVYLFV